MLDPSTGQQQIIDRMVGPAQVAVKHDKHQDLMLSANHAVGEVTPYIATT